MTADTLAGALQPPQKMMSLPRMGRSLELTAPGTPDAKVWWIDPNLVVLWSAKPLAVGTPLTASIDLFGGGVAQVSVTIPPGQPPMKAENGAVCIARYSAKDPASARMLSTALIRINPRAFKADYVPPRLPRSTVTTTGDLPTTSGPKLGQRERAMLAVACAVALLGAVSALMV
jgi:hypothetical protein